MNNKLRPGSKKAQRKTGRIIIISGPSGSGKTTLHKKLLADKTLKKKLVRSVSATTRPKRSGEKEGRDYLFISERQFSTRKRSGYFLESKKVFSNYSLFKHVKNHTEPLEVWEYALDRVVFPLEPLMKKVLQINKDHPYRKLLKEYKSKYNTDFEVRNNFN